MSIDTSMLELEGAGGDTLRAELFRQSGRSDGAGDESSEEQIGVVLVHDIEGVESARSVAESLAAAGCACLLPDLFSREGRPETAGDQSRWSIEQRLPDRRALEDLDRGVRFLAARDGMLDGGVGAVGLGSGGTLAFLLGCTSRDVAAVVAVGGRALYPALSAEKPIQPLELLLNLDRPLLVLCGAEDPDLPEEHRGLWRQKLDAGGKDFELVVYPGGSPAGGAGFDGEPLAKAVAFLHDRL